MHLIHTIAILGGDRRQFYLARQFLSEGYTVLCSRVPEIPDAAALLRDTVSEAELIILPMPALNDVGNIRTSGAPLPMDTVLESAKPGTILAGGKLSAVQERAAAFGLCVIDYAKDPSLAVLNAVPTAEGAIQIAMEHTDCTIWSSRVLIIGFGRIGKALAARLHHLGAEVCVSARSPSDLAAIRAEGYRADRTGTYAKGLQQYDCIFNTVPAPVLLQHHLDTLRPDAILIDLASSPGGLAPSCTSTERCIPALALPGRVAPKTAARFIHDAIVSAI